MNTKDRPGVQQNWRAADEGKPRTASYEVELYSDAKFTGNLERESAFGPYSVLNLKSWQRAGGEPIPALVVRVDLHLDLNSGISDLLAGRTNEARYHGGTFDEELAALLSLGFGCRLKAGEQTRHFDIGGDPRGRPIGGRPRTLMMAPGGDRRFVVPNAVDEHKLEMLPCLRMFPDLPPELAMRVVRSARQYQNALWMAETDPNSGWLLFVSALEVAASANAQSNPADLMRSQYGNLSDKLIAAGGDVFDAVVETFSHLLRSTKKFLDFSMRYFPPEPSWMVASHRKVIWNDLKRVYRHVYDRRSKALHEGLPFPRPMCFAPEKFGEEFSGVPSAGSVSTGEATWRISPEFILLNTFEYLARETLRAWWKEISSASIRVPAAPDRSIQDPSPAS